MGGSEILNTWLAKTNHEIENPFLDLGRCGLNISEPELELLKDCDHLETIIFADFYFEVNRKYYKSLG